MLIFDLLYILFLIFSLPFWLKYLYKKHYRDILKHRLSPGIPPANGKQRLWIHAVSVGEVRSLENFIPQLQDTYPDNEIVLSVTTPAGFDYATEIYGDSGTVTVINAPIDFSFTVRRFIRMINPRILVLNELEIWPNWVRLTHRRQIPIVLINGRISQVAFKRYHRFRCLVRIFFKKIERYLVQADLYRERFLKLGIPDDKITVCGNIKSDVAYGTMSRLPSEQEIREHLGNVPTGKKILVAASTHRSDEDVLIPILPSITQQYYTVIVPRHLDRIEEIEKSLAGHGLAFETWSKRDTDTNEPPGSTTDVLVFDRMGYLFALLKLADMVFMGGTMELKIGGHNLYEPAVLGKPILGGPFYNNFPDVGEELVENGVYHITEQPQQLLNALNTWNVEPRARELLSQSAIETVSRRRGSIKCIIREIRSLID